MIKSQPPATRGKAISEKPVEALREAPESYFWSEKPPKGGEWDAEWDYGVDFEEDDFDWDNVECVVEDIDYCGVIEEWEAELACGLGELDPAPK